MAFALVVVGWSIITAKLGVINRVASTLRSVAIDGASRPWPQEIGSEAPCGELHPGGTVNLNGVVHSAQSKHGAFVASGRKVRIVGSQFGELAVEALDDEPDANAL